MIHKKYRVAFKNRLSSFLQYRLNLGLLIISHLISLSGLVYLWIAIYESGQQLGTYSLSDIVFYYVLLTIVKNIIAEGVGLGFEVAHEINEGMVTNYLLKPFSYSIEQYIKMIGKAVINFLFLLPVLILLILVFGHLVELPNLLGWIQFLGFMFIALCFYFLIYYMGALSSFWLTRGDPVIYGTLVINALLNGSLIPLDLFPAWFQPISSFLPFQFLVFVPIQIFQGRVENPGLLFITGLIWMLILVLLTKFIWKRGIRKYEAVGR